MSCSEAKPVAGLRASLAILVALSPECAHAGTSRCG